jgi:hypothetical protein
VGVELWLREIGQSAFNSFFSSRVFIDDGLELGFIRSFVLLLASPLPF